MYKKKRGNGAVHDSSMTGSDKNIHDTITRQSQLEYLQDMLPQLRLMALGLEEQTLAYLLELAMVEARMKFDAESFQQKVIESGRKV